ncbi:hypothetical protein G7Z17_g974 [Cylindrodendrum hubeiense]|uniref:VWFA domain-containing protein n=1 Tax=Cylindrodendrum hubeiense TaxID=595255 RepID=A0A9P5LLX3_9HYPO|nr:hypothetical protein G7Z17_g974 [Cylindrodendrum hubeiense]
MSDKSTPAVIGCLLDVSGSMRKALKVGRPGENAIERLRAVLNAALQLARAEHERNPQALMFVGVFGLNQKARCPPGVDLCRLIDALLKIRESDRTGHELLIELANENNLDHITTYIQTNSQTTMLASYINTCNVAQKVLTNSLTPSRVQSRLAVGGLRGGVDGASIGHRYGNKVVDSIVDNNADNSEALRLARKIWDDWWQPFVKLEACPVAKVVDLLQRLQKYPKTSDNKGSKEEGTDFLVDMLCRYMYGRTPMRDALNQSLAAFRKHSIDQQRILVLISDGKSTDGDPKEMNDDLQQEKVTIATVYLTDDQGVARRRLYDEAPEAPEEWNKGQHTLFGIATKVAVPTHPIPVLASVGWRVPSSGECALFIMVRSAAVLDEFCSLLLSARFGSADALLDIMRRVQLDEYINDGYMKTQNNPSDQGQSETCYAHAIAAVVHMALHRIIGREKGHPSIKVIRTRILKKFPPGPDGQCTEKVLEKAMEWYPPLQFQPVYEDGARQAVLCRRPVLATFHLSESGWDAFSEHFENPDTKSSVLMNDHMRPHRSLPTNGGHAVVLTSCDPHSLTFLNSWGKRWGNRGSFSVENHEVLELDDPPLKRFDVRFYDIFWIAEDLTTAEQHKYMAEVDKALQARVVQYPSIFELETLCPLCGRSARIADFTGSIRQAVCPHCKQAFEPQPGHLVQALYARRGLGDVA